MFQGEYESTADSLETRISRFLFWNRPTPYSTTGVPPAELLLGRIPRRICNSGAAQTKITIIPNRENSK